MQTNFRSTQAGSREPGMSDSTERFSNRVDDYVKHRPRYPVEVIEVLRRRIGLTPAWTVADVGSGTGISAELFLANGNVVYAVEPNEAMRRAAEKLLGASPNFRSVAGTAENTTLPDRSIDLIVAAQAFHWFDLPAFAKEARRIANPGAWTVLMWNDRQTDTTAFLIDYEKLLLDFGTDYTAVNHRHVGDEKLRPFFGGNYEKIELPNAQRFDFEGLRGRLMSSSYVPSTDDPRSPPMLAELRRVFDRHQSEGAVEMRYTTQLYLGKLDDVRRSA
jgi:ubiquinone/menaquinone biosynthesis C-methylase UbiE